MLLGMFYVHTKFHGEIFIGFKVMPKKHAKNVWSVTLFCDILKKTLF